ncbi:PglZ domain-containing protein [Halobacterium salinarum]|uniref:PglZ domain-containing protein n=1 Tax=Halobacterium salinarum TaxID=2242 RepID=UPI0025540012|nr:PglZ domain-containing protein [Halobacterium salinarum]MDL0134450.1 PglZ domain-containing protein [Halobacterium salinarum]
MGDLADSIITELQQKFDRHPVWVWYDAQEKYKGVLDEVEAALDDVTLARYDGSYFELKRRLYEEDPNYEKNWLFYIPESRNEAEWFRDIHALGRQYRVGQDIDDTPVTQFLVEHDEEIPDAYEDWGQNREVQRLAFFCVLFDTAGPETDDWVRAYLSNPEEYRETIEDNAMADAWDAQLREEYGVTAGLDPKELATQLFFGEVANRAPTSRYDELAADDTRAAAAFCDEWQQYAPAEFRRYAERIEEDYDLAETVVESERAHWDATAFKGIDMGLIRLVMERLAEETYADLPDIAADLEQTVKSRQHSFWSNEDLVDWSVPARAIETLQQIGTVDADEAKTLTSEELAQAYTGDDGWWQIDASYRRYIDATRKTTFVYPKEPVVKRRVTRHYMSFLQDVNRPLADILSDDPTLGTPQTSFYGEFADLDNGTAIIICDGLRYELAEAIKENLGRQTDFEQNLSAVSAALPSITEVGMAAHLPGELGLSLDDDDLVVTSGGEAMNGKSDRVERLSNAGFEVVDMDEVSDISLEQLTESEPVPRVVYSGTIDKLGENLDDDEAFSQVASHVDDVERTVQRLKQAGYTRFVITSDHGFLYTDRLSDDLKVESPDLAPIVKRRFAAADSDTPLVDTDEFIEIDPDALSDLGIDAPDLKLLFPRSVACFKAQGGNMRYFHGGISLQELLVPCLTVTTEGIEESASITYDVSIPDPITNSIVPVEIEAKSGQVAFDPAPTLEVRANIDGEPVADPASMEISPGTNTTRVRLKQGAISGEDTVQFEVIDTDTRETISKQTVKLDLLFGDDDMGFDV